MGFYPNRHGAFILPDMGAFLLPDMGAFLLPDMGAFLGPLFHCFDGVNQAHFIDWTHYVVSQSSIPTSYDARLLVPSNKWIDRSDSLLSDAHKKLFQNVFSGFYLRLLSIPLMFRFQVMKLNHSVFVHKNPV